MDYKQKVGCTLLGAVIQIWQGWIAVNNNELIETSCRTYHVSDFTLDHRRIPEEVGVPSALIKEIQ